MAAKWNNEQHADHKELQVKFIKWFHVNNRVILL